MGEAEGGRGCHTDEQEHQLLPGGALSGGGEHVQSQNGNDALRESLGARRVPRKSQYRTVPRRVNGQTYLPKANERVLAVALSTNDYD